MSQTTILWLNGWGMPSSVFDRLRAHLPEFRHRYADYCKVESLEQMLEVTEIAARETMRSSRAPLLVAGWSLGGLLALRLAARELTDGLVLFGATARFVRPKEHNHLGWADAYLRQMLSGLEKDRESVEDKFRRLVFEEEQNARLAEQLPAAGSWTTPALCAGLQVLRELDVISELPQIRCRTLLVHGVMDRICPHGAAEQMVGLMPDAELLSLADCGHAPFLGREEDIAEATRSWWDEH